MIPDDGSFWFSFIVRVALVTTATVNVAMSGGAYRHWRDARALRGLVSALSMLGGAIVTASVAPAIWETFEIAVSPLRILAAGGLTVFITGLVFTAASWWWQR